MEPTEGSAGQNTPNILTYEVGSQEWNEIEASISKIEKEKAAEKASGASQEDETKIMIKSKSDVVWLDASGSSQTAENDEPKEREKKASPRATRSVTGATGPNHKFYAGKQASKPSGGTIDHIHRHWYHDYDLLEEHHGYIQWLFPVFEGGGMNFHASPLSKGEAKLIREDFELATKFIRSYRMQLNFYGLVLADENTGRIERNPKIWQSRFHNFVTYQHNFLRMNRILTCLGHMGFHRWRKPLLTLLEHEAYETGEMAPCRSSLERFWKKTLEVNTREFVNKTLELPEDREESVFFHHLANNTPEYQAYLAALEQEDEERKADRKAANKKDVADYARIAERERRRREQQSDRNSGRRGGGQLSVSLSREALIDFDDEDEIEHPDSTPPVAKRPKPSEQKPPRGTPKKKGDPRRKR